MRRYESWRILDLACVLSKSNVLKHVTKRGGASGGANCTKASHLAWCCKPALPNPLRTSERGRGADSGGTCQQR
jgi:hypothetical protein